MVEVRIGMLGSGFIGEFHADGLRYLPDTRVVANWGAGPERRSAFARRFASRPLETLDAVCADPEVDLVVVSLPNHLHLEAVRAAAANGKAVACTKPLGRNGIEAAEMLQLVTEAGVFNAYLENVVFNAEMIRMREMVESGAIGRLTTFRAREGHSGPHAAHFWDADLAGGGALLDMASHGAEAARAMFGKDLAVRDVFAWGDTLVHGDRTSLEDNAVMLIRFADGRVATMDVSSFASMNVEMIEHLVIAAREQSQEDSPVVNELKTQVRVSGVGVRYNFQIRGGISCRSQVRQLQKGQHKRNATRLYMPVIQQCGLTNRSSGAPTAGRQGPV